MSFELQVKNSCNKGQGENITGTVWLQHAGVVTVNIFILSMLFYQSEWMHPLNDDD